MSTQTDKRVVDIRPFYKQYLAYQYLWDHETTYLLFGGGASGGKQICISQVIPTPHGYTTMGEVKVGDKVLSPRGIPVEVLAVTEIDTKSDSYKVIFDTGEEVICDERHLWFTMTDNERKNAGRLTEEFRAKRRLNRPSRAILNPKNKGVQTSVTKLNKEREYQYLNPPIGSVKTTRQIMDTLFSRGTRSNHSVAMSDPINFKQQYTLEIDPYLFGLWLGDGYSRDGAIGMAIDDINEINKYLPQSTIYKINTKNRITPFVTARIPGLAKSLRNIGVYGDKRIPITYLRASIEDRISLLQGIMDTDGTISIDGKCSIMLSKKDLIEDVLELINSLGLKAVITIKEAKIGDVSYGDCYRICFNPSFIVFRLKRKADRYKSKKPSPISSRRFIVDIKKVESVPMRCIQVNHPDGMYLVGKSYIPTHNSWLGCEWLITSCLRYPGIKAFIAREKLKTLKATTMQTFKKVARNLQLVKDKDYKQNHQDSYIEFSNGSRIDLMEVKYNPSDPLYEDLGSSEYTIGWLEEAGEIHFNAFDTLKSRLGRHMNDKYNLHRKMLITCNPKKNWLFTTFYLPWKKGTLRDGYQFLQSLHGDNTMNEAGYAEALNDITDVVRRQRLIEGIWEYEQALGTLFDYDAVTDLWTNTIPETTDKYITVDVARKGQDKTVFYFWKGFNLYKKQVYNNQTTDITATRLKEAARAERVPFSHILADEDGIGGSVIDQCRGIQGFLNNSSPLENMEARHEYLQPQNFTNLKTQCAWIMSRKVNNHEVCITIENPEEKYREEFEQELQVYREKTPDDDMKKIGLVSKEEMKLEIGRSPDYGDAFIMRAWFTLNRRYKSYTPMEEENNIMRRRAEEQTEDNGSFLFRPGLD